jgi:hypothetical protein
MNELEETKEELEHIQARNSGFVSEIHDLRGKLKLSKTQSKYLEDKLVNKNYYEEILVRCLEEVRNDIRNRKQVKQKQSMKQWYENKINFKVHLACQEIKVSHKAEQKNLI